MPITSTTGTFAFHLHSLCLPIASLPSHFLLRLRRGHAAGSGHPLAPPPPGTLRFLRVSLEIYRGLLH
jgi:hypothetical protein